MLKRVKSYLDRLLGKKTLSSERGFRGICLRWQKIIYLALRGLYQNRSGLSASSLTYYTLMSIVPILAIAIAIAKGFGLYVKFRGELFIRFPDQGMALSELFKYADAFLGAARGSVIAAIGFGGLFLTAVFLLNNLEGILNQIWSVTKGRSWARTLIDYFALILILPSVFVAAVIMSVFIVEYLSAGVMILPIPGIGLHFILLFINLIPYGLFWLFFSFIYLFMPNTKVHFRTGAIAGLITSLLYLVAQWGYIYFQIGASSYGAIYGSMAALPLFLVWIQVSWYLVLFGAEVSAAYQKIYGEEG